MDCKGVFSSWDDGVRSFLYEMLYNLIDNAIKYNIDGGRVELSVSAGDTGITVSVKDTGIGIPPEYQARGFSVRGTRWR